VLCSYYYTQQKKLAVEFWSAKIHDADDSDDDDDSKDEATPPPFVSFSCFYSKWQRDYGHIKVSKLSEDICNNCVAFSRGSSPKRFGAKSRVREIRPSPALSKFLHLPHGRRTDNSHIFVAHHDRHHAINACFCQQHRLQMSKYSPKAFLSASNITFLMR
jgi:hypothetical protein